MLDVAVTKGLGGNRWHRGDVIATDELQYSWRRGPTAVLLRHHRNSELAGRLPAHLRSQRQQRSGHLSWLLTASMLGDRQTSARSTSCSTPVRA
jgi:hypothetical protein